MRSLAIVSSLVILLLAGCNRRSDIQQHAEYGPISATGSLVSADVSLIRRGSHILLVDGVSRYYVESKTENLREFEGRVVSITGSVEANTQRNDLPIIVVSSITSTIGRNDLRLWNIPALNLRLSTPIDWQGIIKGSVATFSLEGESAPLLTIQLMSGSSLPSGTSFYVKNRPSVRTESRTSSLQEVYVLERGTVLYFLFDPSTQAQVYSPEEGKILTTQFEELLSSITFLSDSSLKKNTSGSGSGVACGGVAGILCSEGFYCNVTSNQESIGTCLKK